MNRILVFPLLILAAGCQLSADPNPDPGLDGDTEGDTADDPTPQPQPQPQPQPEPTPEPTPCDRYDPDACGPDAKCQALTTDPGGDEFEGWACVPVGPQVVGGPCCRAGVGDCPLDGPAGMDTCDEHSICLDLHPINLIGTCTEYCAGSEWDPTCPQSDGTCWDTDGPVDLCHWDCDPLEPNPCPPHQECTPHFSWTDGIAGFTCYEPSVSDPGGPLEACGAFNSCESGSVCEPDFRVGEYCQYDRCCTEVCDVDAPTCLGPDQICEPLFEDGPPELSHLGVCRGQD